MGEKIGRYGHFKEEYTCWCQSFITLKIQFSYLHFPDLLEYSCFQSTSSRHLITRPKILTSLRSIRRQTCDSILSKILRTKLWLQFFFNSSFYVFFFSFLYQELQVIWQPQIRSHMLWCPCMAWVTRYNKFHMVLDSHRCCNSFEDVRDNCFCVYLLRSQIHTPRHGSMRAISNKMNNDRADGHCFAWI